MQKSNQIPDLPPVSLIREHLNTVLEQGSKAFRIIYISNSIGWGKTTGVAVWLRQSHHNAAWITLDDGINPLPELEKLSCSGQPPEFVVLDNLHCLPSSILDEVCQLVLRSNLHFLLLSRGSVPAGLHPCIANHELLALGRKDFCFTPQEVLAYCKQYGVSITTEQLEQIDAFHAGWALGLNFLICQIRSNGNQYSETLEHSARENLFRYFDTHLFSKWEPRQQEFLLYVGCFKAITRPLASLVTGQADSDELLDFFLQKTSIYYPSSADTYLLLPFFHQYLIQARNLLLPQTEINRIYRNAGRYYEKQGNQTDALECYLQAKDYPCMVTLLSEVSTQRSSDYDIWNLEQYYRALPQEIVEKSPFLCCAMAILEVLSYHPAEARQWEKHLQSMLHSPSCTDGQRQIIQDKLSYLSFAIPSSTLLGFVGVMKNCAAAISKKKVTMQNAAITFNMPSILNGGRDFSPLIRHALWARQPLSDLAHTILKADGVGIVDIAIGEYRYQQNNMQSALVEVTSGLVQCEQEGSLITRFAGITVQANIMAISGKLASAKTLMENIHQRILETGDTFILPNQRAAALRFELYSGNRDAAELWLKECAPDENQRFCSLDRFCYFVKMRIYLWMEDYLHLIALGERLRPVCQDYGRFIQLIELDLLEAIAYHRMDQPEQAFFHLECALLECQKYGYIRLIADECEPAYLLLRAYCSQKAISPQLKKTFLNTVTTAAKRTALLYPLYCQPTKRTVPELTPTEYEVLQLLAQERTNRDIADFLGVSLATVKFHTTHIYQKMEVKNRSQAVKLAYELNLLSEN